MSLWGKFKVKNKTALVTYSVQFYTFMWENELFYNKDLGKCYKSRGDCPAVINILTAIFNLIVQFCIVLKNYCSIARLSIISGECVCMQAVKEKKGKQTWKTKSNFILGLQEPKQGFRVPRTSVRAVSYAFSKRTTTRMLKLIGFAPKDNGNRLQIREQQLAWVAEWSESPRDRGPC